jgi:tubulin-specific chaperone E
MAKDSDLVVGETRIRDVDGFCGTVVYIGPVASAKKAEEIYVGIVWDDASRGKHDGSVICRTTSQIVRHFSCEGPTQGSFLRLPTVDVGVALDSALLRAKYVDMQAPVVAPNNLFPHTARTSSGKDKAIEFLGEMQIRERQQLEDIDKVSLRREGISRACNNYEELVEFQHIRDIDLAGNLLSNWETVFKILSQFRNLESLSLASNRIRNVIDLPPALPSLDKLQILNLHSCSIDTFRTIQLIGTVIHHLEELCVAYSDLSDMESIELAPDAFSQLKILDCSSCHISSWKNQAARHFCRLPKLEELNLNDNPIPSIQPQDDNEPCEMAYFPALLALQIAGTAISTWGDMEGINKSLETVKSLRLRNTPLTATMGQGECRALIIARFPTLVFLNASSISTKERIEAERRYVSMVTRLLSKRLEAQGDVRDRESAKEDQENSVLAGHPQYMALREKHKDMLVLSDSSSQVGGGQNLASTVSNLTIISMAASSCGMEPLVRRLPGSLKVGRLKALCARAFGLDVDLMSLHFRTEVRNLLS